MANRDLFETLVKDAVEIIGSYGQISCNVKSRFEKMCRHIMPDHPYTNTFHHIPELYRLMVTDASDEQMQKACVLGWIYSMFQASHIMFDDLADKDDIRNGAASWSKLNNHQVEQVGFDYVLVDSVVYHLLQKHFAESPSVLAELICCFQKARMETCLSCMFESDQTSKFLNKTGSTGSHGMTMREFERVGAMKCAIHVKLEVIAAMTLAGVDKQVYEKAELISEQISLWCQTLDDYNDVFTQHANVDMKYTDIRRGQFSFLTAATQELCKSAKDWEQFLEHYGKDDEHCVEWVKARYVELGVADKYFEYRKQLTEQIFDGIDKILGKNTGVGQAMRWLFVWYCNVAKLDDYGVNQVE